MKKYEVIVEDESAELLAELLKSLRYIKDVRQNDSDNTYTLASEGALWKKAKHKG